jgi:hypothetical protein
VGGVWIIQFQWDDTNVGHLAGHGVTPAEAEQVMDGELILLGEEKAHE